MNQANIRNFCIISHIDHGKSTLADRILEITKTIPKEKMREQFLDQNPISRERGITIKLAPVRMEYKVESGKLKDEKYFSILNSQCSTYILNLIDTPGHVDFSYEVSRTLAACEGAVLLVDATQNVQAQTVAHFNSAKKEGLVIIPVINKIDLSNADPRGVAKTLIETFGFGKEEIIYISAKTGQNVPFLLGAIIKRIPSPKGKMDFSLRALIFDAFYDEHRGVIAYVRVVDGGIEKGQHLEFFQNKVKTEAKEVGYFTPFLKEAEELLAGEIGYVVTGIKDLHLCRVGDTITKSKIKNQKSKLEITPLPGYKLPKPMVFYGIYPKNPNEFGLLKKALEELSLNDTSLIFSEEHSVFLGSGFRVGFLGLLHAEIIKERLQQEEGVELLLTMPQVLYQKKEEGTILEPYIKLLIYTPNAYLGNLMSLCQKRKGRLLDLSSHQTFSVLTYALPYSIFIRGLSAEIKNVSSGFASIDYELLGFEQADLVTLEILINQTLIDILSEVVYRDEVNFRANTVVEKLKNLLPRRQFRQIIQAVVAGRIISRAEVPPLRKDVLKKLSGGDRTRKDKLLEKQKKGKKRLFLESRIDIPQEVISSLISHA